MGNAVDTFARLYLIPGLQHCTGGPGATYCGGINVPFRDAEHDLSAALERWVEEGIAPGELVATAAPDRSNLAATRAGHAPSPHLPVPACRVVSRHGQSRRPARMDVRSALMV